MNIHLIYESAGSQLLDIVASIHGLVDEPMRELCHRELADEIGHAQYLVEKIAALRVERQ